MFQLCTFTTTAAAHFPTFPYFDHFQLRLSVLASTTAALHDLKFKIILIYLTPSLGAASV